MEENEKLFQKAIEYVREVGKNLIKKDLPLEISYKGKTDFVTQMDIYVQKQLEEFLKDIAPDFQLLAEEKDNKDIDTKGNLWILDPIDGTTNFIHGFCHSGISLAMAEQGEVIGGIVYLPYTDELFIAFKGKGAYCNGKQIHVSKSEKLEDSLLSIGTNPQERDRADKAFSVMRYFYDQCHDIRRVGAASVELCYVAAGRLDGYLEHGLKTWDYAAGAIIVKEAGGLCTDYYGESIDCEGKRDVVATNGIIHEEAIKQLLVGIGKEFQE